jgi:hypothetical protein
MMFYANIFLILQLLLAQDTIVSPRFKDNLLRLHVT